VNEHWYCKILQSNTVVIGPVFLPRIIVPFLLILILYFVQEAHERSDSMTTTTMTPPGQQAQVPIPMPPRVITTKDLSYLKDALSWELLAFKKFHFFAQQATNPQVKQMLDKAGQMHQRHYQKLLTHLQVDNNTAMAGLPRPQQMQQ